MMRVQRGFVFNIAWNLWGQFMQKKPEKIAEKHREPYASVITYIRTNKAVATEPPVDL